MTDVPSVSFVSDVKKRCVVCDAGMSCCVKDYFICNACGYMSSNLCEGYGAEVGGIDDVRMKNYIEICNIIKKHFPSRTRILDVGCASGLFLKIAQNEGFNVVGLEPDFSNAFNARAQGFEVINGFFPDAEQLAGQTFDVVIFNDSFEHIPDTGHVIQGVKRCLKEDGVVVINVPSSKGLIFTLSLLMSKLGIISPLERLWQKGFSSPHLHYFNPENLELLFEKYSFLSVYHTSLKCYTLDKLWKRIKHGSPFLKAFVVWSCMVMFYPFYNLLKSRSDITVSFFRYHCPNSTKAKPQPENTI